MLSAQFALTGIATISYRNSRKHPGDDFMTTDYDFFVKKVGKNRIKTDFDQILANSLIREVSAFLFSSRRPKNFPVLENC